MLQRNLFDGSDLLTHETKSNAPPIADPSLTSNDVPRISKQLAAVQRIMLDGEWITIPALLQRLASEGISASAPGVSARIRDLRKEPLRRTVERRATSKPGVFEYRVQLNGSKPQA